MDGLNVLLVISLAVLISGKPTFDDVTIKVDGVGEYETECELLHFYL